MIEIYPPYEDYAYRIEMWGDQIDSIRRIDPLTGELRDPSEPIVRLPIYPKSHYVLPKEQRGSRDRGNPGGARVVAPTTRKARQVRGGAAAVAARDV